MFNTIKRIFLVLVLLMTISCADTGKVFYPKTEEIKAYETVKTNVGSDPYVLSWEEGVRISVVGELLNVRTAKYSNLTDANGTEVEFDAEVIDGFLYLPLDDHYEDEEIHLAWIVLIDTTEGSNVYYYEVTNDN